MEERTLRIAVMGQCEVGKTSIVNQKIGKEWTPNYHPSIGETHTIQYENKGEKFNIEIIDTPGQGSNAPFPSQYTVDMDAYIMVYSINNKTSLENITRMMIQLGDILGRKNTPMVLVANKLDLEDERQITKEEGRKTATQQNVKFMEMTAKDKQQVTKLFEDLIELTIAQETNTSNQAKCQLI